MNFACHLVVISLLFEYSACETEKHPHKVINLPGAPSSPEVHLFSGYLNGSSNEFEVPIFYLLAESIRVDPSTAPLLLWFNGGPGGSSLSAFFKEHGPYRITETGDSLTYHEFSWNQYANVLYLESPLGVGFSQNNEGNMTWHDYAAADINFNALRDFMTRIHPNYADRDYFLSGQSYAGAYIPYFARRLLDGIEDGTMKNANFKGFAIGNPIFEERTQVLSELLQFHNYGLVSFEDSKGALEGWLKILKRERMSLELFENLVGLTYDILDKYILWNSPTHYNYGQHCPTLPHDLEDYHAPTEKRSISCYGTDTLESYLNREDVQEALHVESHGEGRVNWTIINTELAHTYMRDTYVLNEYTDIFNHMNGSTFRVLIYNGDMDVMISPVHTIHNTKKIAEATEMELPDVDNIPAWKFYGDFAGVRRSYKRGNTTMDVLTVRGAGHSVPTDLPAHAFQIIHNFLFTEDNTAFDYSKPIRKH